MHTLSSTVFLLALSTPFTIATSPLVARALNGPCTGAGGAPGTCISTSSCSRGGGTSISGACPNDPADIKCCTKTACGSGSAGNCRFSNTCASGVTETNQCPGPSTFKCCMPNGTPTPPNSPPFGKAGCQQTAINGANKIVAQFPGKILEIGCKRTCSGSSEHCIGMATDLMVTAYGGRTTAGQPIAQWISENASALRLKYVMWGQHIWNPSDGVKPWSQWRNQSPLDRGSNTDNHWDHVHVSYQ